MTEQTVVLSQEKFEEFLIYFQKHMIGRRVHASYLVQDIIYDCIKSLSKNTIDTLKQDIEQHRDRLDLGNLEVSIRWFNILELIERELKTRN